MAITVHGANVNLTINGDSDHVLNLREIPEFSKPAKEKIDVTCLNDTEMKYITGITDGSTEISFKVLYDANLYLFLEGLEDGVSDGDGKPKKDNDYILTLSDGASFTFSGKHTMVYHGGGLNTAAEMSINITVTAAPIFKKGN